MKNLIENLMLTPRLLLVSLVLFAGGPHPDLFSHSRARNSASLLFIATSQGVREVSIENTTGVITLNEKTPSSRADKLHFFNEDGSIWYEFSFYEDNTDHRFNQAKAEFRPFAFHQDYFLLALKCAGEDANRFQVVVNEETQLKRFIGKNDQVFKFQSWEEHILNLFSIRFDRVENPLRVGPEERARPVRLPRDVVFHPREVDGKWLKVSWNVSDEGKGKVKKIEYGWVKWKENKQLLLEFFYFA